jgi:hypothetical protein
VQWRLCRRIEILSDRLPSDIELPFDFTDGPVLRPVQPVHFIDLIGGQHCLVPDPIYAAGSAATAAACCLQDGCGGSGWGGSASITQTCAGAELLFARCVVPEPMSQTCAAEYLRSRTEMLFARLQSLRFWSRSFCRWRLFNGSGILLAILLPVAGIDGAPFPGTVAAAFAVLGVGSKFAPVIVRTSLSLALGSAAKGLAGLKLRWLEELLAAKTTPSRHNGHRLTG